MTGAHSRRIIADDLDLFHHAASNHYGKTSGLVPGEAVLKITLTAIRKF